MKLVQLVYASRMAARLPLSEIMAIIRRAQQRNAEEGITGVMTFGDDCFLQVLEGPRDAVNRLYAKLIADRRHTDLTILAYEEINTRRFAEWSMGFFAPADHGGGDRFDPYALSLTGAMNILSTSEVLLDAVPAAI